MRYFFLFLIVVPIISRAQFENDSTPDISIAFCKEHNKYVDYPLNKKWLALDSQRITNVFNKIPECNGNMEKLKAILPFLFQKKNHNIVETYDTLDNKLYLVRHTFFGGYTTFGVKVLYTEGSIIKIKLSFSTYERLIEKHHLKWLKIPLYCDGGEIIYEITYKQELDNFNEKVGKLYIDPRDSNYRREIAQKFFSDPFMSSLSLKKLHVFDHFWRTAFDHLRYFITNVDTTAMESLLYSPNPVSRLLVARSLKYLISGARYHPGLLITNCINEILSEDTIVKSGYLNYHQNISDYTYFNIDKDFEMLLKTQ
ncbi:MAG: hypothetical protein KF746_18200 [Chitinophagaceae bacterium]|nr:hypothetical protein [Chitinophagaceae bacterium]